MTITAAARALRRQLVIVIAATLAGLAIALVLCVQARPIYSSQAEVFISAGGGSITEITAGTSYAQQLVKSIATVASSSFVLSKVKAQLELSEPVSDLTSKVSVNIPLDELVVEIAVSDSSARRAADIANAIASNLGESVDALVPRSASDAAPVSIRTIEPARVATSPISPKLVNFLLAGGLLGLVCGCIVGIGRETLSGRVRSEEDVRAITDVSVVGVVKHDVSLADDALPALHKSSTQAAEQFRYMRTALQFLRVVRRANVLAVTSSVASEGKSTVVANLAATLALGGETVVVVDADLRKASIAKYFGIDATIGLTDVLVGNVGVSDAVQQVADEKLYILPAGLLPPNPSDLLHAAQLGVLLTSLADEYGTVIVDLPPVLAVSEAISIGSLVDGVLFVASVAKVRAKQARLALSSLKQVDAQVLGVVLTHVKGNDSAAYGYNYDQYVQDAPTTLRAE